MFTGFTQETANFMLGLNFNNDRGWFEAHRGEYEEHLLKPFKALALATGDIMDERYPKLNLQLHIARIYKDARRLHGSGPYKDHLWFSLKADGRLLRNPMFWFEVGAVDYSFGMGYYSASASQMQEFRDSLDKDPKKFIKIAKNLAKNPEYEPDNEPYKRQKKDMGDLLNPWYNGRRIGVTCTRAFGGDLLKPELPVILADNFDNFMPLYKYLMSVCTTESCENN